MCAIDRSLFIVRTKKKRKSTGRKPHLQVGHYQVVGGDFTPSRHQFTRPCRYPNTLARSPSKIPDSPSRCEPIHCERHLQRRTHSTKSRISTQSCVPPAEKKGLDSGCLCRFSSAALHPAPQPLTLTLASPPSPFPLRPDRRPTSRSPRPAKRLIAPAHTTLAALFLAS